MVGSQRQRLLVGFRITSLATLASRVLGMLRDVATAALFGLAGGGVMDAFVIAFRVPNTFRRLFGEGALAASYTPVFAERLSSGRDAAWRLASALLLVMSVVLGALVVGGQLVCGALWYLAGESTQLALISGLLVVMLPYLLFICITAQAAASLQALGRFTAPAVAPIIMNVCWLAAAAWLAPAVTADRAGQAYVLAAAVLISGILQMALQGYAVGREGFRFVIDWKATRDDLRRIVRNMLPMIVGLAVTQVNTLADTFLAWGLARTPDGPATIGWLSSVVGEVTYPMERGAVAAIYYGERLYQLPQALLGVAAATVIFPLLARHAAAGRHGRVAADLTWGLRLVLFLAGPATAGLVLLAHPIAQLLFERGDFTPADTARTARMIAAYGLGVWAYSAIPLVVRGYYALGDYRTPVRVAVAMVGVNMALNLVLIWPLAEMGLALATSITAAIQAIVLGRRFAHFGFSLGVGRLTVSVLKTLAATVVMAAVVWLVLWSMPSAATPMNRLLRVAVPIAAGAVTFFAAAWATGQVELRMLLAVRSRAASRRAR